MYEHGGDIYNHIGCVDFSANINFLGLPKEVKAAIAQGIEDCEHYPDTEMKDLRNAIADREKTDAGNIICSNGAAELIFAITAAVMPKKALIFAPGFQEYEQALSFYNSEIFVHSILEKDGFALNDIDRILSDISCQKYDIIFLCNPNNPTGILTEKDAVIQILDCCKISGTILVVDECFLDFVESSECYSVSGLVGEYNNLIVLKAFTKIFAMPGLRLGYGLCGNRTLTEKIRLGMQPWNVSVIAQKAGVAAAGLRDYEEETRKLLKIEKQFLIDTLKTAGFQIYGYSANYIFFKASADLYEKLLQCKIYIRDCSNYRGLTKGFYRIAVRTHEENEKFACAIKKITNS